MSALTHCLLNLFSHSNIALGNDLSLYYSQVILEDKTMHYLAQQDTLTADKAFIWPDNAAYQIRWWSAYGEIQLCGHGLLGSAWFLLQYTSQVSLTLYSKQYQHICYQENNKVYVSLPIFPLMIQPLPIALKQALHLQSYQACYYSRVNDVYLIELASAEAVSQIQPDFQALLDNTSHQYGALIITAKHRAFDFCYRYFTPWYGKNEDQATGSAQTMLANLWSKKCNLSQLTALQLSKNQGVIEARLDNNQLWLSGNIKKKEISNEAFYLSR